MEYGFRPERTIFVSLLFLKLIFSLYALFQRKKGSSKGAVFFSENRCFRVMKLHGVPKKLSSFKMQGNRIRAT